MMKTVVLLAPTPPPTGGIAGWTARMMEAHLKNDWEVHVVDEKLIGGTETFGEKNKKRIITEVVRTLGIYRNLIRELKDPNVKIIHSCIPSTTGAMLREYICCALTHCYKRRFVIHYRCTVPNTTKGRLGHWVLRKLSNYSDAIITLNNKSKEYLEQFIKTTIVLIPNFIDESEINERKIINPEVKTVVYVGGVIKSKGCLDICKIAESYPYIQFRLIGQPSKEVTEAASHLCNVIITGPLAKDKVKEELNNADLFLFLSYFRGEGFSNSLTEAMAYGIPCIVTDWAANADMIENKGGIVIPIKEPQQAIKALDSLKDPKERERCSYFNIQKIKENYVASIVLNEYVDLYEELLKR